MQCNFNRNPNDYHRADSPSFSKRHCTAHAPVRQLKLRTGFCPKLPDHYGQSYGKATHQIIRERPRDLLKERLSAVRHRCHQDRSKDRFSAEYTGDRHYVDHGRDGHGMDHRIEGHCHDHGDDGRCLDHHCRIRHTGEYSDHDRNRPYTFGYVGPTYVFFEGFTGKNFNSFASNVNTFNVLRVAFI
ncbi:hypothetical protein TNCV_3988401 [Trichonephila clavipes]|nr:hypothetical protein TNCV_3988401 [Trichonephila clavipes]